MLILKPNCEWCDKSLLAHATDAMICSYECTFCKSCVEHVLANVCPNCGGGFCERPIRPAQAYRKNVSRQHHEPSKERVHTKYSAQELEDFIAGIKTVEPANR